MLSLPPLPPRLQATESAVNDLPELAAANYLPEVAAALEPAATNTFLEPTAIDGLLELAVENVLYSDGLAAVDDSADGLLRQVFEFGV